MEKIKPVLRGPGFLATGNPGKLREMIPLCGEYFKIETSLVEGWPPIGAVESEDTFSGNALIKSRHVFRDLLNAGKVQEHNSFWVLSDDSGLSVDALNGKPGVHSARYAGDHVNPEAHMQKLIRALKDSLRPEPYAAYYSCALSLIVHDGTTTKEYLGEGTCSGQIVFDAQGDSGFGYDPIFYVPEFGKTFAQTSYEQKNSISHRRRAFEALQKAFMAFAFLLLPKAAQAADLAPAEQSFRDFMRVITQQEARLQLSPIPPSAPLLEAETIDPQNFSNQDLLALYARHLDTKSLVRWELSPIGSENEVPPARPNRSYYNSHVFKVFRNNTLLKIYRPIDTTTGCETGCAPVAFHLAFDPRSKSLELIEDPVTPLQKTGHQAWSQNDKDKMQKVLQKIPSWFSRLPSPSQTTRQEQTWPLYEATLVPGAAYTSYRILETALQLLEFSGKNYSKDRELELAQLSTLLGDAFRINTPEEAMLYFKKLSTNSKSYSQTRFQSTLKALVLAWIFTQDPKFTARKLVQSLGVSPFAEVPSLQCFVIEEIFLTTSSAHKLWKSIERDKSLGSQIQGLCPSVPQTWLSLLAGHSMNSELNKQLKEAITIPEFLKHRPYRLKKIAETLSDPEDLELQKQFLSYLSAIYPRLDIDPKRLNPNSLKQFVEDIRKNYESTLSPQLGTIPSETLSNLAGPKSIPIGGKQVYVFFASWCPHCKTLLRTLKEEIRDDKLWAKVQLLESFSNSNSLTEAQNLCHGLELPKKICQEILLVPNDKGSQSLAAKIHLFAIPKVIITDDSGNILDFDFKIEEGSGVDPLRKLKWILERPQKR